ncbi:MAG: hypothetical protein HUU20_04170 [Pirellulales bacterium]|nr:hypothetical protein [Pirellulales bacterium]
MDMIEQHRHTPAHRRCGEEGYNHDVHTLSYWKPVVAPQPGATALALAVAEPTYTAKTKATWTAESPNAIDRALAAEEEFRS